MSQTRAQLVKGFSNTSASDDAVTVDSSGNVLVGKTSSSGLNAGCEFRPAGMGLFTRASSNPVQVRRLTDDGDLVELYKDSTLRGSVGVSGTALTVGVAGTERLRILSGGGITFNGDTAAANALDDYEEGTFTGRFNNSDDDATVSHGNQTGFYVKVGSLVHFSLYFDDIDVSGTGSTTNARIFGLPFTSLGTAQHYSVVNIIHNTIITSSAGAYVNTNSTVAIPTNVGTTTTSTFSTGTNFRLMIGGTYRAA